MKELVEANRLTRPIPNPFVFDAEAEAAAAEIGAGEAVTPTPLPGMPPLATPGAGAEVPDMGQPGAGYVTPGYRTSREVIQRISELLGLQFASGATETDMWQQVINRIPQAGFEAQQLIASLRFDPESSTWHTVDIGQLVNPAYI